MAKHHERKGGRHMKAKGTKQIGKKVGQEKAIKEMRQHDRGTESRGSMGMGKGIKAPKASTGNKQSSRLAKKLESTPL